MMDWSAEHSGFVVAAYLCVGFVWLGVAASIFLRTRALKQELARLDINDVGQKELT
jgi:hypothetical protein